MKKKEKQRLIQKLIDDPDFNESTEYLLTTQKKNKIYEILGMLQVPLWGTAIGHRIFLARQAYEEGSIGLIGLNALLIAVDAFMAVSAIHDIRISSDIQDECKEALEELILLQQENEEDVNIQENEEDTNNHNL